LISGKQVLFDWSFRWCDHKMYQQELKFSRKYCKIERKIKRI
jgi:hypothetical protein